MLPCVERHPPTLPIIVTPPVAQAHTGAPWPKPLFAAMLALLTVQISAAQCALLTTAERGRLIGLTRDNPVARDEFHRLIAEADSALEDSPNPIRRIQTEGKLAGDPVKIATAAALGDMRKLEALGYAYAIRGEPKYAAKARAFILAWATTNQPTGDPIDETNLEPLIVAYDLTLATFQNDARKGVDAYLRRLIQAERNARQVTNNWQSHRLKIEGLAAYVLGDDDLIKMAVEGFKKQIGQNLRPDGSSLDFVERDALHYHVYDLEPLLALAIASHKHGLNLYDYTSPSGASLRKSVHFLVPYCTGEKQHREFVNSTVRFDRERAANGEKGYQIGHLFRPEEGLKALSLAAYFDETVDPVVREISVQNRNLMVSWILLLDSAERAK